MTGIDTNVLVRYITRDEPDQYRAAKAFLESHCTRETPGFVNAIVLCELVWVLTGAYDATRDEVVRVIDQLLRTRQLQIERRDQVHAALNAYQKHSAGFADCLLGQINLHAGCTETVTFDQDASAMDGWQRLST
jgi:predicted nucleic-acid-binding protein